MRLKITLVFLFIAMMVLIDDSDAWRRRRRRRWIRIRGRRFINKVGKLLCNSVCSNTCTVSCPKCAPVCSYGCKKVCTGKRDVEERADDGKFLLKLPCRFDAWDTDGNGSISLEEFAFAGHTDVNDSTKAVFEKVDINGDGMISEGELDSSSLVRETC